MSILKQTDTNLYYESAGHGPPVLLIQGVGVVGGCWRPQADALAQRFRTLLFDNRGIGKSTPCHGSISIESMAADARALMDAAGWESAHVVGHSMGGVIAQQLALDCPQRVRSLSLLCTFARGKDAARLTPWVLWMTLRSRIGTRRMRRRAFLEMLWGPDTLRKADKDALAERVAGLIGRDLADQPSIVMKQLMAMARHDVSSHLPQLRGIPSLVASAEYDRIALPRYGRLLAEALAGQFETIAGASHGVTIQLAEEVSFKLIEFLTSVEAGHPAVISKL
jgi:pimeloyl-ACP methyl ester carboxylesterase